MKILVTAKRVEDPESKIKVKPDGTGIVKEGLKYKINPFDEIAVEEGLRLTAKHGGEVVVVSIGAKEVQEQLRHALAMGSHKAIWINHAGPIDQMAIALSLQKVIEREKPDLVILGKQSIDDDQNQVGQYLAEFLGWGQATFASKAESFESDAEKNKVPAIAVSADGKSVQVVREVDGGLAKVECQLPAVVTTAGSVHSSVERPPSTSRMTRTVFPSGPSCSAGTLFFSASDSKDSTLEAKVACEYPSHSARYWPTWFWSSSIDCLPRTTMSGFSFSATFCSSPAMPSWSSGPVWLTHTAR